MKTLRRIAAVAVLTGALVTGGLAAPASADVNIQMYIEYGPFSSSDECEIHRYFNPQPATPCNFQWDDRHPIGWYYGVYS
jgi:hypothetical protein